MNIVLLITSVCLILLYFFLGRKVCVWITISRLGFSTETPELFLRHPKIYHLVPIGIFLATVILLAFTSIIVFVFGFIILLFVSFVIAISGRQEGLKIYRSVLREMLEEDRSLNDQERKGIAQQLDKPDAELLSRLPLFH